MAGDINVVVLVGRLTRNAELRYPQNGGNASLRFSIAVNRSRRNASGEWEDEANFFDCVYFTRSAESLSQYLEKGRQVAIQGELRQSRWEDQNGQSRSRIEIFVNSLSLVSQGQGGQAAPRAPQAPSNYGRPQSQMTEPSVPGPEAFQDDNIPF